MCVCDPNGVVVVVPTELVYDEYKTRDGMRSSFLKNWTFLVIM